MTGRHKITVRPYEDSTAVITGGTSGVGLATARLLALAGVRQIALLGRNIERGEAARQQVLDVAPNIEVIFVSANANEVHQAKSAVDQVLTKFGHIDILINSTIGLYTPNPLLQIPPEKNKPTHNYQ